MNAPTAAGALLDARYRVGPVIARGGMSTVYRGTDTRLDRPVAIKVMEPRLAADPAFRARFEREARSAARIDHPAVVDVYDQGDDVGADGPVLFLVMELVEGATLRDVLRSRGALGVPAALAVMEQVLAGLAQAHRLGMVHRDVKPENVLISRAREVKVADFGLVTAAADAGASHVGMIMGTAAYLSPEQVASGAADVRSDVYAAGILLYELLTGAPPYTGDSAISVAYQHVTSDVPAPSLIAGEVPPELDDLVLRATRRDPAGRPADAATLLAQLRQVADRLEVPRVSPPAPPVRPLEEQDTVPRARRDSAAAPGPPGTRTMPRPVDIAGPHTPGPQIPGWQPPPEPFPHLRARRRSRQVFAVWLAVVLVLALLVAVSAWWLGAGRWTAMPSLVGVELAAAEQLLAEADLVPSVVKAYDNGLAAGRVAGTDPAPDARLLRGSNVTLTVSTGQPTVPAVAPGTSVADAEQALRVATLNPVRSNEAAEFSATVPEGAVVRTDPAAGTALSIGGSVTLVLSRGAEPMRVRVPLVIGETFGSAADILDKLDLGAQERPRLPFGLGTSQVVGQSHGVGSMVERGTTITLDTL